jgi:hypothetical protein
MLFQGDGNRIAKNDDLNANHESKSVSSDCDEDKSAINRTSDAYAYRKNLILQSAIFRRNETAE